MFTSFNRRTITLGIGVFYAAIGALGFVPGLATAVGGSDHGLLFGLLGTSDLLNVIHLAIGAAAIWASQARAMTRPTMAWLSATFALLVGASFAAPLAQSLGIAGIDTVVHLASLVVAGYLGLVETKPVTA